MWWCVWWLAYCGGRAPNEIFLPQLHRLVQISSKRARRSNRVRVGGARQTSLGFYTGRSYLYNNSCVLDVVGRVPTKAHCTPFLWNSHFDRVCVWVCECARGFRQRILIRLTFYFKLCMTRLVRWQFKEHFAVNTVLLKILLERVVLFLWWKSDSSSRDVLSNERIE